ncbi:MAG: hypothetical protein GY769_24870 [bacterium]|nr:hypothetical protein [bacterium]
MSCRPQTAALLALCGSLWVAGAPAFAAKPVALEHRLGRNDVRVFAAPHRISSGDLLRGSALPDRLSAQGYRRVRHKPKSPGEFFWGLDRFWIFRREFVSPGRRPEGARLIGINLNRANGRITRIGFDEDATKSVSEVSLEPVLLSETLEGRRAPRAWVPLDQLPEHVWRSVLAIEDARFFEHGGVDPRSVARAVFKNAKAGRVTQGGSTITQQLIKMRDLTPRRTMGRKISEAMRALALEAEYDKREILEAYLNSVYLGHSDGTAVYGVGSAARFYFGKSASELSLGESALLAGMVQGPNRLHPGRNPEPALARQRSVLARLHELEWLSTRDIDRARRAGLPKLRPTRFEATLLPTTLAWIREDLGTIAPRRAKDERGVVVQTTLDAHLQALARGSVRGELERLERRFSGLRREGLGVALVALDGTNGDVLAVVGADPRTRDDFDRARSARRQPGSSVKPLVLLEALESCGVRDPLYTSRRIADRPLTIELPGGPWSPANPTGRYRGTVDLRTALVDSLNVPLVRIARWCGFEATAERFRAVGLDVPSQPPPSFALGSVEVTPVELASAFTTFVTPGRRQEARLIERALTPSGRGIGRAKSRSKRVVRPSTAYLVRDLLREAGAKSLGARAFEGLEVIGKTGTSSERRDAWFAGSVGSMVVVVWVGYDDGGSLGLSGAQAAVPIWRAFAERAAPTLRPFQVPRPRAIVERWIDPRTGLRVRSPRGGARREIFRDGDEPRRKRLFSSRGAERPVV